MAALRDSPPNNLPHQLTGFIGRKREIIRIKRLLANTRLVTLTESRRLWQDEACPRGGGWATGTVQRWSLVGRSGGSVIRPYDVGKSGWVSF